MCTALLAPGQDGGYLELSGFSVADFICLELIESGKNSPKRIQMYIYRFGTSFGDVAQLAGASALQAEGHEFKPRHLHYIRFYNSAG